LVSGERSIGSKQGSNGRLGAKFAIGALKNLPVLLFSTKLLHSLFYRRGDVWKALPAASLAIDVIVAGVQT
jgi:hypothetical protein